VWAGVGIEREELSENIKLNQPPTERYVSSPFISAGDLKIVGAFIPGQVTM
jgi:hypothetical protein